MLAEQMGLSKDDIERVVRIIDEDTEYRLRE